MCTFSYASKWRLVRYFSLADFINPSTIQSWFVHVSCSCCPYCSRSKHKKLMMKMKKEVHRVIGPLIRPVHANDETLMAMLEMMVGCNCAFFGCQRWWVLLVVTVRTDVSVHHEVCPILSDLMMCANCRTSASLPLLFLRQSFPTNGQTEKEGWGNTTVMFIHSFIHLFICTYWLSRWD